MTCSYLRCEGVSLILWTFLRRNDDLYDIKDNQTKDSQINETSILNQTKSLNIYTYFTEDGR